MEIFLQKSRVQLARHPRQTHRKLQQHESQEHRDETIRGQRGKRFRGLEKTFRRRKGFQDAQVQGGSLSQDLQVQKHFFQGLRAELH